MDQVAQSKEDFILNLIVVAVMSFRKKLDQDIDLNDREVYTVCFVNAIMSMAKTARPSFPMSINAKVTKGKIVRGDEVIDNHIWVEFEKFPIDLTLDKDPKDRCKLEFPKGIVEKIKADVGTHYPDSDMAHSDYAKFMRGTYSFRTEGTKPLFVYVQGLFSKKS